MDIAVTVGVVVKKVLEVLASNKNGRKFLGYVIGITLFLILLPLIALVGLFGFTSGGNADFMNVDKIVAQLSADDQAIIEQMNTVGNNLPSVFTENGLTGDDTKKGYCIYVGYLVDKATDTTVDTLAWCFVHITTGDDLYNNIKTKFSVDITEQERDYLDEKYGVTKPVSATAIDASGYTDKKTKNNIDLVIWANNAYSKGWGYVTGTYGTILTEDFFKEKMAQYPDDITPYEQFIRDNWLGGRTADCVGLIKGYGWLNADTGQVEIGSNGIPDVGAVGMYDSATEKGTIDTMPEIPGLAVYIEGQHIGIYIGDGYVIHASSTEAGVIKTKLSEGSWTHWLKIPYINYK